MHKNSKHSHALSVIDVSRLSLSKAGKKILDPD